MKENKITTKMKGNILTFASLKDIASQTKNKDEEIIYVNKTDLVVFEDGSVYIDPMVPFVREFELFEGFCVPIKLQDNCLELDFTNIKLTFTKRHIEEKEEMPEDMLYFGRTELESITTKEELFRSYYFETLIEVALEIYANHNKNYEELLEKIIKEKAKKQKKSITLLYKQKLEEVVKELEVQDISNKEYLEKIHKLISILNSLLPTGDILAKQLKEEEEETTFFYNHNNPQWNELEDVEQLENILETIIEKEDIRKLESLLKILLQKGDIERLEDILETMIEREWYIGAVKTNNKIKELQTKQ